jgi:hypothetical protein
MHECSENVRSGGEGVEGGGVGGGAQMIYLTPSRRLKKASLLVIKK